jgi:hypothetical protein
MVNAVAAVLQRIEQALLDPPGNQFARSIMFEGRWPDVLDRGHSGLGKYDDLHFHADV